MDPETPNQPLIGGQTVINVPSAQGGRSTRAFKVAGLTLFGCVLVAGQVMIAYLLLSQRSDIRSLEDQGNNLNSELTKGRSGAGSTVIHMHSLPGLMDDVDEEASTGASEKTALLQATDCQLEAAGMKHMEVPFFHPTCDERGLYLPQQCFMMRCWCVNPVNGQEIPGSMTNGMASCPAAVHKA